MSTFDTADPSCISIRTIVFAFKHADETSNIRLKVNELKDKIKTSEKYTNQYPANYLPMMQAIDYKLFLKIYGQ